MSDAEKFALALIRHNAVPLRTHMARFNAGVSGLLAAGLIEHAPRRAIAYKELKNGLR